VQAWSGRVPAGFAFNITSVASVSLTVARKLTRQSRRVTGSKLEQQRDKAHRNTAAGRLKLSVQAHRESIYRTALRVVGGVVNELIVETYLCRLRDCVAVVGLEYLL
jgi:hypothetical protein